MMVESTPFLSKFLNANAVTEFFVSNSLFLCFLNRIGIEKYHIRFDSIHT